MPLGGRKKGIEWQQVSEIEGNSTKVICDYCQESISKKIEKNKRPFKKLQQKELFGNGK